MSANKKENKIKDLLPSKIAFNQSLVKWSTFFLIAFLLIYVIILLFVIFTSNIAIYDEIIGSYTILGEIFIGTGIILGVFLFIDVLIIVLMEDERSLREDFFIHAISPLSETAKELDAMEIKIGENLAQKQYRKNTKIKVFTAAGTLGIGLLIVGFTVGFITLDNFQKPIPVKYLQTADPNDKDHMTDGGRTITGFTEEFTEDWKSHKWNTLSFPTWVKEIDLPLGAGFSNLFDEIDGTHKLLNSITNIRISDKSEMSIIKDNLFSGCNIKSNVYTSKNVITIGEGAFQNNTSGTSVRFGNNLQTIGESAFENFGKESSNVRNIINFPASITSIGENAFKNYGEKDSAKSIVEFNNCSNLTTLGNSALDMLQNASQLDVYMPNVPAPTTFTWNKIFGENLQNHKTITLHLPKNYPDVATVAAKIGIGIEDIQTNL